MKFASLFTGFGGADIGAMQAGLDPIWGVESDADIALVADQVNDCMVYRTDVKTIPFEQLETPDWLHVSPPCVNASRARNGIETGVDVDLAYAICRAIETLKPDYFSLENVTNYAQFKSFMFIKNTLHKNGYHTAHDYLDCSDYGVPQSRKRLFLVASKHLGKASKLYDLCQQKSMKPNWYDAIKDLIPELKLSTITEWQRSAILNKFPKSIVTQLGTFNLPDLAIQRSGARKKDGIPNNTIRLANQPMFTIRAMNGKVRPSVNQVTLIIDGQPYEASPKCLARWQTFPDWYQLPEDKKLAIKGIGNAVPPLMMQQIIETVLG